MLALPPDADVLDWNSPWFEGWEEFVDDGLIDLENHLWKHAEFVRRFGP